MPTDRATKQIIYHKGALIKKLCNLDPQIIIFLANYVKRYVLLEREDISWEDADKMCKGIGGSLAAFKDDIELTNALRTPEVVDVSHQSFWIGLRYSAKTNLYSWQDGTIFPDTTRILSRQSKIDKFGHLNHCVIIYQKSEYGPAYCDKRQPNCLCQVKSE